MLKELRIKNFAIIDEIDIDFQPGLTVVTGEKAESFKNQNLEFCSLNLFEPNIPADDKEIYLVEFNKRLEEVLDLKQFDIIHAHYWMAGLIAKDISNKFNNENENFAKAETNVRFLRNNLDLNYKFNQDSIELIDDESKIINHSKLIGNIKLDPFFFDLDLILSASFSPILSRDL